MKQIKHTVGPWKIERDIDADGYGTASIVSADDEVVIENVLQRYNRNGDASNANARLVAAAPELLEALKYVQSVARNEGLRAFGLNTDLIDTALIKATGETA